MLNGSREGGWWSVWGDLGIWETLKQAGAADPEVLFKRDLTLGIWSRGVLGVGASLEVWIYNQEDFYIGN